MSLAPTDRSESGATPRARAGGHVWIVDDSPLEARRAAGALDTDYSVEVFADASIMLEKLSQGAPLPHLLVLDWQLPGVSGLEACVFLRERYPELTLPILVLTASTQPEDLEAALTAGANEFVRKPYSAAELLIRVRALVRRCQRAASLAEERQQLLEYLEHGDACLVLDASWVCVFANENFEKMARRPRGELLGRTIWDLFSPMRGTSYETQCRRVMRERVQVEFEEYYEPLDLWAAVTAYPTRGGGVAIFARDATARRRAEDEAAKMAAVVEMAPDFVGICRPDGTGLFVNPAGRRLVGLDSAEAVRHTRISDYFTPECLPDASKGVEEAMRTGFSSRETFFRHFKTGEPMPVLWQAIVIKEPRTGEPLALATVTRDLREQKRLDAEAQRRADFERQLIGIVSHDLRNPISAIVMGASVLLRRPDMEERQRRTAERILTSASRANRLIHDLLDFTQARLGGGLPVRPARADFHAVVRQVFEESQVATAPAHTLQLEQTGDGEGHFDADRVAQMAGNLLSNALQYGEPQVPVCVSTRGEPESLVLEVHNGGRPIPPELQQRLFRPMQRGVADVSEIRSVGLGLYIVDQVVRAHRGQVEVTSTAEAGTTFTVRLPRGSSEERLRARGETVGLRTPTGSPPPKPTNSR